MAKSRIVNVNGNAGAEVAVACTIPCRKMRIREVPDPANPNNAYNPQGLRYHLAADGYTQLYRTVPGAEIVLPGEDEIPWGNAYGNVLGWPAQDSGGSHMNADVPIKLLSDGATATVVMVEEYD